MKIGCGVFALLLLASPAFAQRATVSADLIYYLTPASNGGNNANDCLTPATACIDGDVPFAKAKLLDGYNHSLTFQYVDGGSPITVAPLHLIGPLVGFTTVKVVGNLAHPSNVNFNGVSDNAIIAIDMLNLTVSSVKLTATGAGSGFACSRSYGVVLDGVDFGQVVQDHIGANRCDIIQNNPKVSGGATAGSHDHGILFSTVSTYGTVQITGPVSFGGYWSGLAFSFADYHQAIFSGSNYVTGYKYLWHFNSVVDLSGVVLPGSLPGDMTGGNVDDTGRFSKFSVLDQFNWTRNADGTGGALWQLDGYNQLSLGAYSSGNFVEIANMYALGTNYLQGNTTCVGLWGGVPC